MQSNTVKAILILIVLIDHNDIVRLLHPDLINPLSFHVLGFLSLPFIITDNSSTSVFQKSFRYFIPYLFFFSLATLVYQFVFLDNEKLFSILKLWGIGLITGSGVNLKASSGFYMFWFLPCLISLGILKSLIPAKCQSHFATLLVSIILACLVAYLPDKYIVNAPLQLFLSVFILPQCILIGMMYKKINNSPNKLRLVFAILLLGIMGYLYSVKLGLTLEYATFSSPDDLIHKIIVVLSNLFISLSLLLLFNNNVLFKNNRIIQEVGKYSLVIYLVHNFLNVAIRLVYPGERFEFNLHFLAGLHILGVLILSYIISKIIFKLRFIKPFIFPKDTKEFKSLISFLTYNDGKNNHTDR